jgi:hypothetical protein
MIMPYSKTEKVQQISVATSSRNWSVKLHSALVGISFAFVIAVIFGLVP